MITATVYARIALIATMATLCGCASGPEYTRANSADDYGYHSSKLNGDRYRIVYNGGSSAGPHTARDYAMLHAGELTLREGYDWFRIVDRETVAVEKARPATGVSYERAYYVQRSCGLLACSRSVRPWTTARMDVDSGRSRATYSHALEIVMGKGELPADGGDYYEAAPLVDSLLDSI
jgi:hypothetical protein